MFSLKNKKQNRVVFALALFLFASGAFFLTPSTAHAIWGFGWVEDTVTGAFKALLYGIFVMFGWFASVAITIFGWAIRPENISGDGGLLNRASVYASWKLIRDFFNLFFILTLLYTAFTIIFQVAKDYKKTLLSLVLAALFVNFSFPITRLIIDVTNVPMYYFVNQMGTTGDGKSSMGTMLSATRMQDILIPGSGTQGISAAMTDGVGVSNLLMAIVFLFIFSISLLVLAVLFIIRLVALIMLLIFSSVGFAASVIPGLGKYSSMWWEKLWQYALFGPVAMLMLYIATRFFAEIAKDNTSAQFLKQGIANASPESAGFISAMAMFTIPIIMLWMTIAMAASSSIVGASAVAGQGQKFLKWAGKSVTKTPAMWAGHKIDESLAHSKYGRYVSPGAWKQAWQARSKEHEREAYQASGAVGDLHDSLNSIVPKINVFNPRKMIKSWKGQVPKTEFGYQMRQSEVAKYKKEVKEKTNGESSEVLRMLKQYEGEHNPVAIQAAQEVLAEGLDLNDLTLEPGLGDTYTENHKLQYTPQHVREIVFNMLIKSGVDEQTAMRQTRSVLQTGFGAGNGALIGGIKEENGTLRFATDAEWAATAVNKVMGMEPQKRQQFLHENSYFNQEARPLTERNPVTGKMEIVYKIDPDTNQPLRDAQGNQVPEMTVVNNDLHDIGGALILALQKGDKEQIKRIKGKTGVALMENAKNPESQLFQRARQSSSTLDEYLKELEKSVVHSDEHQTSDWSSFYRRFQAIDKQAKTDGTVVRPPAQSTIIDPSTDVNKAKADMAAQAKAAEEVKKQKKA